MKTRGELPYLFYPRPTMQTRVINAHRGTSGSASTLLTDLAHWWDLTDTSDSVGGATLTNANSIPFSGTAPNGDACPAFPDPGGLTNTNDVVDPSSRTSITIGLWFKRNGAGRSIWYYGAENYITCTSDTNLVTRIGSSNVTLTGTWNVWNCVVMRTNSSTEVEFFFNGSSASVTTRTFDFTPGNTTFDLGALAAVDWTGNMATCAIWDRALTNTEVTEFYNSGTNLRYSDL